MHNTHRKHIIFCWRVGATIARSHILSENPGVEIYHAKNFANFDQDKWTTLIRTLKPIQAHAWKCADVATSFQDQNTPYLAIGRNISKFTAFRAYMRWFFKTWLLLQLGYSDFANDFPLRYRRDMMVIDLSWYYSIRWWKHLTNRVTACVSASLILSNQFINLAGWITIPKWGDIVLCAVRIRWVCWWYNGAARINTNPMSWFGDARGLYCPKRCCKILWEENVKNAFLAWLQKVNFGIEFLVWTQRRLANTCYVQKWLELNGATCTCRIFFLYHFSNQRI